MLTFVKPEITRQLSLNSEKHINLFKNTKYKRFQTTKISWNEDRIKNMKERKNVEKSDQECMKKELKETKQIVTRKLIKQTSLPNDSVLLSHQQLAEKLKYVWKEREKSKRNLKIFLAQNISEKPSKNSDLIEEKPFVLNDNFVQEDSKSSKIISLNREFSVNDIVNCKTIFHKKLGRSCSVDKLYVRNSCISATNESNKISTIMVPYQCENNENCISSSNGKTDEDITLYEKNTGDNLNLRNQTHSESQSKNVIVDFSTNKSTDTTPLLSAKERREKFRNANNAAFSKKVNEAVLTRSSSTPLKCSQNKPKSLFIKRRVKSAAKKSEKKYNESIINEENLACENKLRNNFISSKSEIITMVSLVSPEESEVEDHPEQTDVQSNRDNSATPKSVSFQPGTIHAVRSFSASFPRRSSIATELMATQLRSHQMLRSTKELSKKNSKRLTLENKTVSVDIAQADSQDKKNIINAQESTANCSVETMDINGIKPEHSSSDDNNDLETSPYNLKEKQAWDTFCKINKNGVTVSFDTVLRGMLTPTEYRLRKKSNVVEKGKAS